MPEISGDDVAHLARLSRLTLTDNELQQFAGQLDSILSHVRTIAEVADDEQRSVLNTVVNVTREDQVMPGFTPEEALAQAPAVEDQRFMVPRILGEAE
ncbi:Asp-tRNA(Asn)/Glu-tRNA(Gln) amidotransferase subunit GatC [Nocardia sp. NPDC058658]|uniref:Asp-tRNA(Asn)/Glu-tRNA(Gln) amidotransferase subunit GatC n=1 Tax=Nocardia sp. NPDC058658 TaxID=3346580 RepID=UPI0036571A47